MADVNKIKLPDNTTVNIKDSRISGIDTTPTPQSTNVVTSNGIFNYINPLFDLVNPPTEYTPTSLTKRSYTILDTNKYGTNSNYKHVLIPVDSGYKVTVKSNSSNRAQLAWLTSDAAATSGGTPQFVSGTGKFYTESAGSTESFIAPTGANFLYVYLGLSPDYTLSPTLVTVTGNTDIEVDSVPTEDSDRLVRSGGVYSTIGNYVPKNGTTMNADAEVTFTNDDYLETTIGPDGVLVKNNDDGFYLETDSMRPSFNVYTANPSSLDTRDSYTYYSIGAIYTKDNNQGNSYTLTFPTKTGTFALTSDLPTGLPSVSSSDNGKTLQVVNGAWATQALSGYLPLSGGTMDNTNLVTNLNANYLNGYSIDSLVPQRIYSVSTGWLVKTDITINRASNQHIYFKIEGKSSGNGKVVYFTLGGAVLGAAGGQITRGHALNVGEPLGDITVFLYDDYYYLWFDLSTSYTALYITVYTGAVNHVESITDAAMPDPEDISQSLTITPISIPDTVKSGTLTISTDTSGTPTLIFQRGTTSDNYVDHKIKSSGGTLGFYRSVGGNDTSQLELEATSFYPVGTLTDGVSNVTLGSSTNYWDSTYAKEYYVGSGSVFIRSSADSNIYFGNSSGGVLVVDGKVVRRNTAASFADTTLGSAAYPWGNVYSSEMTIIGETTGTPTLTFRRGVSTDAYADWKQKNNGGIFDFVRSVNGTDISIFASSATSLYPVGTLTNNVSDISLGSSTNQWAGIYANDGTFSGDVAVTGTVTASNLPTYYHGTSDPSSSLGSDGDIYMKLSS